MNTHITGVHGGTHNIPVKNKLSLAEIDELREAFERFDKDGSGQITGKLGLT